ncbi:MAG: caspase family protein [Cyanobacteria bacterium P01_D01_bin.105]
MRSEPDFKQVGLSRRAFFKQTAAAIAAFGLTDIALNAASASGIPGLAQKAKAYAEAIAQTGSQDKKGVRKLALLIGIDDYPVKATPQGQADSGKLEGCVTDVEMQRQLLIHRFGFAPDDVLCLTEQQATRTGIYQAFVDHLYDQAKAGDVVVVHFSGYGAQVRIDQKVVRSLVPYDGLLPTPSRPVLNDISEAELNMLLRQLKTKNITTVIDAGFVDVGAPLSGGLRARARAEVSTGRMPAPYDLLADKRMVAEDTPFPGLLLRGAGLQEAVIERQWNGFHAGAFTYVLTQHLWLAPPPVTVGQSLGSTRETLSRWGGSNQQPMLGGAAARLAAAPSTPKLAPDKALTIYNTAALAEKTGIGVVQSVSANGQQATLWLGGMAPRVLEYLAPPAVLTCGGHQLDLGNRDGVSVKAKLVADGTPLQVGQPVLEAVRTIPKSVDLVVALDSQLERIERVDATSALSALSFVTSTSDTKLPADCLLAKPLPRGASTLTASLNVRKIVQTQSDDSLGESGYGLFSLMRSPIPGTLAMQDEAIKPAINRLTGKLKSLLALKLLRLSENRASSTLPVTAVLETIGPKETVVISRQITRLDRLRPEQLLAAAKLKKQTGFNPQIPLGTRVRYRLFNNGEAPLYYTLITVDPRERLSAFCPVKDGPLSAADLLPTEDGLSEQALQMLSGAAIAPGTSIAIPSADQAWPVDSPAGLVETYIVCSTRPLASTFGTLLSAMANSGSQRINPLPDPLTVVEALLSDMSQSDDTDAYSLDVSEWATLNFTYQAVETA